MSRIRNQEIECCFCGDVLDEEEIYGIIGSTKLYEDKNEGKYACMDCLGYDGEDYFECAGCADWFDHANFGGHRSGVKGIYCYDCFKGR
jgi:hypothetical protein